MSASYSMYPVSGSTSDRKFRIASSWSTMVDGRLSDDAEEIRSRDLVQRSMRSGKRRDDPVAS